MPAAGATFDAPEALGIRRLKMIGSRRRATFAILAVGAAVAALANPVTANAATNSLTCAGGSVPAGTYDSLTIAGFCMLDDGNVTVNGNVTLAPNSGLNGAFGGSNLTVGHNLLVGSDAILVLGCEPEAFICFNDPDQDVGTLATHDSIGQNLVADGALMMLIHNNQIGGNVSQSGGGGGDTCDNFPLGPDGPPAYSTYEDNQIGRNAAISGIATCWMGFIRNHVAGNVSYNNVVTADPDGNEITSNVISRNLNCSGDDPKPQFGDSSGVANIVGGQQNGQCTHIT